MAAQCRAFGDITNKTTGNPAQRCSYRAPFFKSEKTNALINYYKTQDGASSGPCVQFFTSRVEVIANNIQDQPFLVPITDRACKDDSSLSIQKHQLWSNLSRLSFDEICDNLESLKIPFDRNSPKDFLVDTLRRYLINDIN